MCTCPVSGRPCLRKNKAADLCTRYPHPRRTQTQSVGWICVASCACQAALAQLSSAASPALAAAAAAVAASIVAATLLLLLSVVVVLLPPQLQTLVAAPSTLSSGLKRRPARLPARAFTMLSYYWQVAQLQHTTGHSPGGRKQRCFAAS